MSEPWRSIKRHARRELHTVMQVPAIVISGANEYPVSVRVHRKLAQPGDLSGTNLSYAETSEDSFEIIFWRYQMVPVRGMKVSVELGEAYYVEYTQPPDDIIIKAICSRASAAESLGLALPDAGGAYTLDVPTTWYPSAPSSLAEADEFLPIPELLAEDATYFYMGWELTGGWLVRRKLRSALTYVDANVGNNPTYTTLAAAWVDYSTLTYA